jgi:LPXTG-motif cell wall-anchored protein
MTGQDISTIALAAVALGVVASILVILMRRER